MLQKDNWMLLIFTFRHCNFIFDFILGNIDIAVLLANRNVNIFTS